MENEKSSAPRQPDPQPQHRQAEPQRQPEPQPQVQAQPATEPQHPAPRQPADTIRDSNLKANIWRNESENGAFYATTFARTYRDTEGHYRDSNSFGSSDLLKLSELARTAYTRTNELRREDREQSREPNSEARRETFRAERRNTEPSKAPQHNR